MKILKLNKVTPKKKELMKWGFTTISDGEIKPFKFPNTDSSMERMVEECSNKNNWGRYPGPHPEGRGSRAYTMVTIIPDFDFIRVHSLFFPDGRVWDSTLRDFRRLRDYEQGSR